MEYPFKDLLPLDEVLERESYYKDWTHLDPEVFYSLTQISDFIKTKGYGVDVRLLIAQLAEHFGLKTTQVVDLANLLQQNFTHLEGVTQSFTDNINSLVAQMEADKNSVIANATLDSEVILARGGKPTLQARLDETTAQLAQTANKQKSEWINVLYPPAPLLPATLDGTSDDTTKIRNIIATLTEGQYIVIPKGVAKLTNSLDFTVKNTGVVGIGGKLEVFGDNFNAINLEAEGCFAKDIEIYSQDISSGRYGIDVRGGNCLIDNVYIHDIKYMGVMFNSSFNTVQNSTMENCGWDAVGNFGTGVGYNKAINCKAIKTGRHGFSTDAGTHHAEFIDCLVVNLGDPGLAEGHSPYHFEYSNYGRVENCKVLFNGDSRLVTTEDTGTTYTGVFNLGSKSVEVDGLEIIIESTFNPIAPTFTYDRYAWLYEQLTGTASDSEGFRTVLKNCKFYNHTDLLLNAQLISGYVEIMDSEFHGRFYARQVSTQGQVRLLKNVKVFGKDKLDYFYEPREIVKNLIVEDSVFRNVKGAIKGRTVDTYIRKNHFVNSFTSVRIMESDISSTQQPENTIIEGNVLENLSNGLEFGQIDSFENHVVVRDNILKGAIPKIVLGYNFGYVKWLSNITHSSLVFTTVQTGMGVNIYSNLKSEYELLATEIVRLFDTPPTSGTHTKGTRFYVRNPSAGGYIGYVCTASGAPGTWKGFGLIQA